jgi:hypothetical protein
LHPEKMINSVISPIVTKPGILYNVPTDKLEVGDCPLEQSEGGTYGRATFRDQKQFTTLSSLEIGPEP